MSSQGGQVVYTNKAHCRDCYRCLRVCPVKAIGMEDGQAYVVAERCISCGTCIRECPQGAKAFRNDVDQAARLIASGVPVGVSIAPSFASAFTEWERKCLPSALRRLGFAYVGETAIGAYYTAVRTRDIVEARPNSSHITTACPVVVNYIERYRPDLLPLMIPVVSPMLAHARRIKERLGNRSRVVFIGPCVAKKAEAERPENAGVVDCVLTFTELEEWFEREGVQLAQCEESHFDEEPEGDSRYFPLVGGILRTARMETDVLAPRIISASGFDELRESLEVLKPGGPPMIIEPLFCHQGCINGPVMPKRANAYTSRQVILSYAASARGRTPQPYTDTHGLDTRFTAQPVLDAEGVSEEQIRAILEQTGKASPENQLNCGACGYATCRDKAIAVVRGLAEPGMCIPYMRRLAEQRTDRIIETSPNGIVILDEHLRILSMNPAFRRYFMCSEAVCGRPISYLMDAEPFEQLATGKTDLIETTVKHARHNLVCHQIQYALREERQYVGIFVNITRTQADREKLDRLRTQTVAQAQQLLQHQVEMAQTIAGFLGESTAQSETLLERLMLLAGGSREADDGGKGNTDWIADTYTSK
ncbi:MAG TPA: 4Fe-4S dicluster domain-containing protein [Armatimonadetes bacterium]|jgi:iron only hydrogenase large subunit-like protein/uncharacterized Fe-S cluster-containing protein|nr:4Fe-4S dicluster domain-containing protein [Armatimonadota bacterium]